MSCICIYVDATIIVVGREPSPGTYTPRQVVPHLQSVKFGQPPAHQSLSFFGISLCFSFPFLSFHSRPPLHVIDIGRSLVGNVLCVTYHYPKHIA
jgi:hypothetical protein